LSMYCTTTRPPGVFTLYVKNWSHKKKECVGKRVSSEICSTKKTIIQRAKEWTREHGKRGKREKTNE
jgi:hypothetical protein